VNKYQWCIILGLVFLLIIAVGGCKNPLYTYEGNMVLVGGDGEPIMLVDNPDAVDPTYAELVAFIEQDTTDANDYLVHPRIGYVCADFAEDVHNNAEAAGIRVASVSIDFEGGGDGHALNAFDTVDMGLIYIDCTGQSSSDKLNFHLEETEEGFTFIDDNPSSWDAVAYVEVGKEYGLIPLASARVLYYDFYQKYKEKWQIYQVLLEAFNDSVDRFNQEVKGKTFYEGSPELAEIEAWQADLESQAELLAELGEDLGNIRFKPKGTVQDIWIHWGPE